MLGAHQGTMSSWLLSRFLLTRDRDSSILNHKEGVAQAEWEILYKRVPRGSLESSTHSCWGTEASKAVKAQAEMTK